MFVFAAPGMEKGQLAIYLQELILKSTVEIGASTYTRTPELIDSVRFLW